MPTSVELRQQRGQIWERMKELVDGAERENRDLSTEEDQNWQRANTDISALDSRIERQLTLERTPAPPEEERRIPGRESPARENAGTGTGAGAGDQEARAAAYRSAFEHYVRFGRGELDPEEHRLLRGGLMTQRLSVDEQRSIGTDSAVAAGYLVPDEYERTIRQNMLAFGGMREVATIMATDTGADLIMPTSDDTGNTGELLAEHGTVSAQDVNVGRLTLKAHMYSSKRVNVSWQLLQDAAFDLPAWLQRVLAERIARITNTHFTTGSGGNQPYGVTLQAATGVSGATGQTTICTWDDLINLEHKVDPAYRRNARYMFHDNTLSYLRRIKDGEGRYLWQPGATAGAPSSINGWPYTINQDIAQMAASAISVVFGDFSTYTIRDVRGFFLVRMDEVYAPQAEVAFIGFSRHDGLLLNTGTNPLQTYVNSAA